MRNEAILLVHENVHRPQFWQNRIVPPLKRRDSGSALPVKLSVVAGLAPSQTECDLPPVRSHLPINREPRPDRAFNIKIGNEAILLAHGDGRRPRFRKK